MPRRAHKRNASSQRKSKKIRKRETKEMNFDNIDFKAVLMMVLKYVPSRRNAAMVNKEWYNAVAQADSEENIYRINFDGYETKQEEFLPLVISILESQRSFTDICISNFTFLDDTTMISFEQVLNKYQSTLKKLTLHKCVISDDQLVEVLKTVPKIQEFSLTSSRIKRCNKRKMNFRMPCLKKVDLTKSFYSTRLQLSSDLIWKLLRMFARESTLKSFASSEPLLKFSPLQAPLEGMNLKELRLDQVKPQHMKISDLIERQNHLQTLDLTGCFIMDDVLNTITGTLFDLKVLKINLDGISTRAFASVSEMPLLRELHIVAGKVKWIANSMASSDFDKLRHLSMSIEELAIPPGSIATMLTSLKKMNTLRITTNNPYVVDTIFHQNRDKLNEHLKCCIIEFSNLNFLKSLPKFSPQVNLECALQELTIQNANENFSKKANFEFLNYFVDLKKLTIIGFQIDETLHNNALMHHPDLEYLELRELKPEKARYHFGHHITEAFYEYGNNLKVMKIDCIEYSLPEEVTQKQFSIIERRGVTQILRHR